MQRYHAANCNSAVNNGALGGRPARDISRAESFLVPPSSYLNSRRSSLTSYNLRCDKEQLNPRIGPPDFHPQTPNCREETLNREYVQFGYRDTVEGLEETREISLSQVQAFTRPPSILKCKEAIRKCHRAINETRAQKRKAGQFYGVPLSGTLIIKPGIFPDQRPCSEDFRKKWFEIFGCKMHFVGLKSSPSVAKDASLRHILYRGHRVVDVEEPEVLLATTTVGSRVVLTTNPGSFHFWNARFFVRFGGGCIYKCPPPIKLSKLYQEEF